MPSSSKLSQFVRRLKTRQLEIVSALNAERNVSRAALGLGMSQPAVSKALGDIEMLLGCALFTRRAKGITPTPIGESIARHANWVLETLDHAAQEIEALSGGRRARLVVGANYSSAAVLVPKAILSLGTRNRAFDVILREGPVDVLMPELQAHTVDIILARITDVAPPSGFRAQLLFDEPMRVVCRVGHPLDGQHDLTWADTQPYPWLLPALGSPVREGLEKLFNAQSTPPQFLGIESSSPLATNYLMRSTDALSVMPEVVARDQEHLGRHRMLPISLPPIFGTLGFITASSEPSPHLSQFIDALIKTARTLLEPEAPKSAPAKAGATGRQVQKPGQPRSHSPTE